MCVCVCICSVPGSSHGADFLLWQDALGDIHPQAVRSVQGGDVMKGLGAKDTNGAVSTATEDVDLAHRQAAG